MVNDKKYFSFVRSYSFDATCSFLLLKNQYKNMRYNFVNYKYEPFDNLMSNKTVENIDEVFFVGIAPNHIDKLNEFKSSVVLCNQEHYIHLRDKNKNRFIVTNISITKLTNKYLQHITQKSNKKLNEFVDVVEDNVLGKYKFSKSIHLNWLFWHLGGEMFLKRFDKFDFNFTEQEKSILANKTQEFKTNFNALRVDKISDNACLIATDKFLEETCFLSLKKHGYKHVFCFVPERKRVYIRSRDRDIDLGELVRQFSDAGGIKYAASFGIKNSDELFDKTFLLSRLLK